MLGKQLGSGGAGIVYQALDMTIDAEIAVKILRTDCASLAALERLRREVIIPRAVISPHVVRVYDLQAADEPAFITMELIRGESLRQRLTRAGPLPLNDVIQIAHDILAGLQALHALGIVHRDLKPANVLFDEHGVAKIADFGVARYVDDRHASVTGTSIVGTPHYIAPEQLLHSRNVDGRADLFALGVLMFEMLTCKLPFDGESTVSAALARLHQRAADVRSLRPDVYDSLASVISRLLERDPQDRFATAMAVTTALQQPQTTHYRVGRRWVMRSLAVSMSALGSLLLLHAPAASGFSRLERLEDGIAAISTSGERLWERTGIAPEIAGIYACPRLSRTHEPTVAAVLSPPNDFSPRARRTLTFLDERTGTILRQATLPSLDPDMFSRLPDRFRPDTILAHDFDRDGIDEVLLTYTHVPEAPSYVVLYEPVLNRARIIFVGMGHHRAVAACDVDGDGRQEVILVGINNGFTWYNVAAAIRIEPWIGEALPERPVVVAQSPDIVNTVESRTLLWYALLPRGHVPDDPGAISWNGARRLLTIQYPEGSTIVLSDQGFAPAPSARVRPAARQTLRRQAFRRYREAMRLAAIGAERDSLDEIGLAVRDAQQAKDEYLLEALQRAQAKLLISAGRRTEGLSLFHQLVLRSENASDIAYDAAFALHLHGDLAAAVEWYTRGLGPGASVSGGKSKHEFIQGMVLALVEMHEFDRAIAHIERFIRTYARFDDWTLLYREYVRWRSGTTPDLAGIVLTPEPTDLARYWTLEFRYQHGEHTDELLRAVTEEVQQRPETLSALLSLQAELLAAAGQRPQAGVAIARAMEVLEHDRTMSIIARGHADIVRERYQRLTSRTST